MMNTARANLFFRLTVLTLMTLSLWVISRKPADAPPEDRYIPIRITRQLAPSGAVFPVELRCGEAHLPAPWELAGFDCALRNNTGKSITAANAIYSITVERNGLVSKESFNSFVETLGEPEFEGANNPVAPGEEVTVGSSGPTTYPGAAIKEVEIRIDYVEFDDQSTLGPNKNGSQIIRDFRAGASRYKEWLSRQYKQNGKTVGTILPLLGRDQTLPAELGSLTPNQVLGANSYRNRLLNIYQKRGGAEVVKVLD